MTQEIVDMVRVIKLHRKQQPLEFLPMKRGLVFSLITVSLVGAVLISVVFAIAMWDIYYRLPFNGVKRTVFRRMVGINDQPVRAMKFFNANKIKGIVFNRWTNGGYVAFGQTPDKKTGRPSCKVFIDGRAQAAYKVSHFTWWTRLSAKSKDNSNKKYDEIIKPFAKAINLSASDPKFFDKLVELDRDKPKIYKGLFALALNNHKLYNNLLKREGITAMLLSHIKSKQQIDAVRKSSNWEEFYVDDHDIIFLRMDAPENAKLLSMPRDQLKYPDELGRKISLGVYYCGVSKMSRLAKSMRLLKKKGKLSSKEASQLKEYSQQYEQLRSNVTRGLKLLMSVNGRHIPIVVRTIAAASAATQDKAEVLNYFKKQRELYKGRIDRKEDFGRFDNVAAMALHCDILSRMAKDSDEKKRYRDEKKYYAKLSEQTLEANRRLFW